jgi:hypothetical protein
MLTLPSSGPEKRKRRSDGKKSANRKSWKRKRDAVLNVLHIRANIVMVAALGQDLQRGAMLRIEATTLTPTGDLGVDHGRLLDTADNIMEVKLEARAVTDEEGVSVAQGRELARPGPGDSSTLLFSRKLASVI